MRDSGKVRCLLCATAMVFFGCHDLAWATESPRVTVVQTAGQAPQGWVEIHGVGAGSFRPDLWTSNTLHFLPDYRHPILRPRWRGTFRNIYAPSTVQLDDGRYRVFFGAWDGSEAGNDCIYSIDTADFLEFENRRTVIDHNQFVHVCNVNCIRLPTGEFRMMCTAYPDRNGQNKPAVFSSTNGESWNGSPGPHPADMEDLVDIEGYTDFVGADINGMNVLFWEGGEFSIYFCDFKNFGKVFRASGVDGKQFTYEGPVLEMGAMVNDVKKFTAERQKWYLMGLHQNGAQLFYSLSQDPLHFPSAQVLGKKLGEDDQYIVAIGWVVTGNRLQGYLYGAGAVPGLDRNRIFARWLQKKVVFVDETGKRHEPTRSLGPDRQLIPAPGEGTAGHFEIYAEDGITRLVENAPARLQSGALFTVR